MPFHSTWNALELNLSCGENPATTALAMEQRIHTSILDYHTSLQKPQLYSFVNHGTRTVVTIFCADGHGKAHKVVCKEGLFSLAQQPNAALGHRTVQVSRSHTHTHTHTHRAGLP